MGENLGIFCHTTQLNHCTGLIGSQSSTLVIVPKPTAPSTPCHIPKTKEALQGRGATFGNSRSSHRAACQPILIPLPFLIAIERLEAP